VTSEAIPVRHPLRIEHFANLMRLVAIHARRQRVCFFLPQLSTDDLAMHNLNLSVAFRTCSSDVAARDGRSRIGVRKNGMRRVAGNTVGRDNEALLEQGLPMDTLREILQDMVLMDCTLSGDRRAFRVALST